MERVCIFTLYPDQQNPQEGAREVDDSPFNTSLGIPAVVYCLMLVDTHTAAHSQWFTPRPICQASSNGSEGSTVISWLGGYTTEGILTEATQLVAVRLEQKHQHNLPKCLQLASAFQWRQIPFHVLCAFSLQRILIIVNNTSLFDQWYPWPMFPWDNTHRCLSCAKECTTPDHYYPSM